MVGVMRGRVYEAACELCAGERAWWRVGHFSECGHTRMGMGVGHTAEGRNMGMRAGGRGVHVGAGHSGWTQWVWVDGQARQKVMHTMEVGCTG
jgi:hypothetical protein